MGQNEFLWGAGPIRSVFGIWSELPPGSRWANEGIHRVIGFMIEGAAAVKSCKFIICVPTGMADTVRVDLREIKAEEFLDWEVVEPPDLYEPAISTAVQDLANEFGIGAAAIRQAVYANQNLMVEGWIVSFPHFVGALVLNAPRTTLLPDAIPFDFPLGWGPNAWMENGDWPRWREAAGKALRLSPTIVAHSKHVAVRHGVELLKCDPSRIVINPHPAPDLSGLLDEISRCRTADADSPNRESQSKAANLNVGNDDQKSVSRLNGACVRVEAAETLRSHARVRGWGYLADYPFEESNYIVISTQDRPTKNILLAVQAVNQLLKKSFNNIKLFTTAKLQANASWTELPRFYVQARLEVDVVQVADLPRLEHAALFHCAAVTVHPSFYEGIVGTLTFFESVSVGTPCLMAAGPHVNELLEFEPALGPWIFDPYDSVQLSKLIGSAIEMRSELLKLQKDICKRWSATTQWSRAAELYCKAALDLDGLPRLKRV